MPSANRRQFLTASVAAASTVASMANPPRTCSAATPPASPAPRSDIRFCLNTSTIRGQKLPLEEVVDLVIATGYNGIEPWIREIEAYRDAGKSLPDLKKRIADGGLQVESSIGFAPWIINDDAERAKGLEQLKRDMDLLLSIGGHHIAAPPVGMQTAQSPQVDLFAAAERYYAACEVGRNIGVTPQVEVWGFSKNLSRLGETAFVAIESGHPNACILPDVYHIYKGGSSFEGLKLLSGCSMHCFHFNDYPADPPRAEINDSKRVYPGDGVAPWGLIMPALNEIGFKGVASLELFNPTYWEQDPKIVLATGLKKMKAIFSQV